MTNDKEGGMRVYGHDGLAMRVGGNGYRPRYRRTHTQMFLRAYMRMCSFIFVGLGVYAAWLHAPKMLAAALLSAVVTWVWSNANTEGTT